MSARRAKARYRVEMGSDVAALEWEETVLSALSGMPAPACVRAVLAGASPGPAYWEFLLDQHRKAAE